MRGGRSLLILLVVALGLGAYIYFVEAKREPPDTKAKVFTVDNSKIDQIEIHATSGDTTTLKKNGDTWEIVAPVSTAADRTTVDSVVDALSGVEVDKVLEENPTSLSQFGLQPARLSVSFQTAGDSATHQLNIGDKTPTGGDLYAQVTGQPRLLLIQSYREDTLNKTTFDLRDKTPLSFTQANVDSVSIDPAHGQPLALARKDTTWRLTKPFDTRADATPVDDLLSQVSQARMTSIVSEGSEPTPAQLRTYGLASPQVIATFGSGSNRATLAVGSKSTDGNLYARDLSRPMVFTVPPSLLTDLQKTPDDFRVRDVFEFKAYSALGLDVTHGATAVSFTKSKPTGKDTSAPDIWKETRPQAKDLNTTAMTDFLNALSSLRIDHFVASAPASGDDVVVTARSGDEKTPTEEHVTLRKAGNTVYALRSGDPGAGVVPTADFDKAVKQFGDLTSAKAK